MHSENLTEESQTNHPCDVCDLHFSNSRELSIHNETIHGNKVLIDKAYLDNTVAENERLNRELANLKDDFERLHNKFETSKNNANNNENSNDVELAKAREEFRVAKAKNVFLLEKNETLFKLGKLALDNNLKDAPEMEVISDQDEDGLDTLVASSLENRRAGFSRVNPATYADKVSQKKDAQDPNTKEAQEDTAKKHVDGHNDSNEKKSFCHYYSNFGHCIYEEKTGKKCKFSHVKAPVCNFDGKCTCDKCMYSHTKPNPTPGSSRQNQSHFLYQGKNTHQQMSPWQAMAPLMEMLQNIPGMWGMQGQTGKTHRRF